MQTEMLKVAGEYEMVITFFAKRNDQKFQKIFLLTKSHWLDAIKISPAFL